MIDAGVGEDSDLAHAAADTNRAAAKGIDQAKFANAVHAFQRLRRDIGFPKHLKALDG